MFSINYLWYFKFKKLRSFLIFMKGESLCNASNLKTFKLAIIISTLIPLKYYYKIKDVLQYKIDI